MKHGKGFPTLLVVTLLAASLAACAEFGGAGREIKEGARDIGHAARDAGKEVGQGARGVARELGEATEEAVRDLRESAKDED